MLDRLAALARIEAPDLAVSAALGLLWLTIMSATWMVPNNTSVPVRLGLTAWWSFFCGSLVVRGYLLHLEALREFRHKNGLCPACGFDLRETPDRCPECGTIPT